MVTVSANEFLKGGTATLVSNESDPEFKKNSMSGGNVIKDVGIGIAKEVGATVKGLGDAVAAGLPTLIPGGNIPAVKKKIKKTITPIKDKIQTSAGLTNENLKADNTAQKVGKAIGFAAEVATPFVAGKIPGAARAAGAAVEEGAAAAGRAAKGTTDYLLGRTPKLLGIFTGEGDDVIRAALKNPDLADVGIAEGDAALRAAVREGSQNSVAIRSAFLRGHSAAKKQILGQYQHILVPKPTVKGIFNNILRENAVDIGRDGTLDFTRSKIVANPGEIKKIQDAYNALNQWDTFTIDSLDEYKQLVGRLTRFADEAGTPSKSPTLGRFYNELNNIAANQLPKDVADQYKALNNKFSENIELYEDIVDAFNSGDPFTKLANSLGKNKDTLRQTLEFYAKEGGEDVLPIVAGRELAMEKTAAFGILNPRSWMDFFISPVAQAKAVTWAAREAKRVGISLTGAPPK